MNPKPDRWPRFCCLENTSKISQIPCSIPVPSGNDPGPVFEMMLLQVYATISACSPPRLIKMVTRLFLPVNYILVDNSFVPLSIVSLRAIPSALYVDLIHHNVVRIRGNVSLITNRRPEARRTISFPGRETFCGNYAINFLRHVYLCSHGPCFVSSYGNGTKRPLLITYFFATTASQL